MTLANQIVFISASLSSYILSLRNFTKTQSEKTNTHDAVTPFLRQGRSCGSKKFNSIVQNKNIKTYFADISLILFLESKWIIQTFFLLLLFPGRKGDLLNSQSSKLITSYSSVEISSTTFSAVEQSNVIFWNHGNCYS